MDKVKKKTSAKRTSVTSYLGLGSNLGDRKDMLLKAIDLLRSTRRIEVMRVSSFYENPAIGLPDQPDFMNCAISISTTLKPMDLWQEILRIEQTLGRARIQRWAARTIDIDILLYGRETINLPSLIIPHPEMYVREFVLKPLQELGCRI